MDYINNGSEELFYEAGLKDRPEEIEEEDLTLREALKQ
jgi:hypothetical protein